MKMRCPHCGIGGAADSGQYGKKVRCPGCRAVFRVTNDVIVDQSLSETLEQLRINDDPVKAAMPETDDESTISGHGLGECSRCGFSFSSDFLKIINDLPVCPACAGETG